MMMCVPEMASDRDTHTHREKERERERDVDVRMQKPVEKGINTYNSTERAIVS